MNTELGKSAKNDFENFFQNNENNAFFGKMIENSRKHRDIKLLQSKQEEILYLESKPTYHTKIFFFRIFITHRNKKNTNIHK